MNSFSEELYIPVLILHIVSGVIALLVGTVNLMRKKGDEIHKSIGSLFVLAMLISSFSSIILSIIKSNVFLFLIGFLTLYLIGMGIRYPSSLRRRVRHKRVKWTDWILPFLLMIYSVCLFYLCIVSFWRGKSFGYVLLMFGLIGAMMVYQDFINLSGRSKEYNFGVIMHIQRMVGSYIAALTAFLVVNITLLPGFVIWTLPTLLFTPFIVYWTRKYRGIKKIRPPRLKVEIESNSP